MTTTTDPKLRVWRLNDCDWVAARTLTEAIDCLVAVTGIRRDEATDGEARALSASEMRRFTFHSDEEEENVSRIDDAGPIYKRHSFAKQLQILVDDGTQFPCYFASTEF